MFITGLVARARIEISDTPTGSGHGRYFLAGFDTVRKVRSAPRPSTTSRARPAVAAVFRTWRRCGRTISTRITSAACAWSPTRWASRSHGTRHKHYPFGHYAEILGNDSTRMKFTGHERDDGFGLDYMLARYYGANLGRFLSVDPRSGIRGNRRTPQRWNRYAYARNNPIAFMDPDGREELKVTYTTRIPQKTVSAPSLTGMQTFNGGVKTSQSMVIQTDPSKGPAVVSPAKATVGWTIQNPGGPNETSTKATGNTLKMDAARNKDGSVTVTAEGNESNPLMKAAPGITYEMSLTVDSGGNYGLSVDHDRFPNHTVTVTREDGSEETLYEHDVEETGDGPSALIPIVPNKTETTSGKLEEKK